MDKASPVQHGPFSKTLAFLLLRQCRLAQVPDPHAIPSLVAPGLGLTVSTRKREDYGRRFTNSLTVASQPNWGPGGERVSMTYLFSRYLGENLGLRHLEARTMLVHCRVQLSKLGHHEKKIT